MSLIGVPPSSSSRLTIQLTPFATDEAVPVNPGNGRTPQYGSRISTCDLRLSGRLGGLSGLPDMGQPPRDHVLVRTIGSEAAAEARIGAGLAKRKRDELLELLRPGFGRIEAWKGGERKGWLKSLALRETEHEKKDEHSACVKRKDMGWAGGVENGIN